MLPDLFRYPVLFVIIPKVDHQAQLLVRVDILVRLADELLQHIA